MTYGEAGIVNDTLCKKDLWVVILSLHDYVKDLPFKRLDFNPVQISVQSV